MTSRMVAGVYALLATIGMLLFATTIPPMQNPDEAAHAYRADQISHLVLMRQLLPNGELGGRVESGLKTIEQRTAGLPANQAAKVTAAMEMPLPWGEPIPLGFSNAAINPPTFYIPSAITAWIARTQNIPLPHGLILMRIASGAVAIAISALAIALAGPGSVWLYMILLLPMSIELTSAVSQDGIMLACTALAAAIHLQASDEPDRRLRLRFLAICVLLAAVALGRSPYLAFSLIFFSVPVPMAWRVTGFACVTAGVVIWNIFSLADYPYSVFMHGRASPMSQFQYLWSHPLRIPAVLLHTAQQQGRFLASSFVGQLGYFDVVLPRWYLWLAGSMVLASAGGTFLPNIQALPKTTLLLAALAAIGCSVGMVSSMYLTWTAVGADAVDGVQGRYFLPLAIFLVVLSSRRMLPPWAQRLAMVFPVVSIPISVHAILVRYYI